MDSFYLKWPNRTKWPGPGPGHWSSVVVKYLVVVIKENIAIKHASTRVTWLSVWLLFILFELLAELRLNLAYPSNFIWWLDEFDSMDESTDWEIDQLFTHSLTDTVALTAHPSQALTACSFRIQCLDPDFVWSHCSLISLASSAEGWQLEVVQLATYYYSFQTHLNTLTHTHTHTSKTRMTASVLKQDPNT